jgi:L-lactate dehydrogenase (cytochrome)
MSSVITPADQPVIRASAAARPTVTIPGHIKDLLCLEDFEAPARRFLPRPIFGFIQGGVESNSARDGNRAAFSEYEFLPRVLVNTKARHQKTTLFGRTYDLPFGFPPMGGTALAAYRGDLVLAKAAQDLNTVMIQSGAALTKMEDVKAAGATAWFQAYLPGDPTIITPVVERAQRAGFEVLVLTVDVQVSGNRENNVRSGFSSPLKPSLRLAWDCALRPQWTLGTFARTVVKHGMPHIENMGFERMPVLGNLERPRLARDALSWEHVALMRKLWKGKLVLKGVLSPHDVRMAREAGVDGIMVSNHGGRQLDHTVAPLRMLPAVAAEAGNMTIMLDSGVRRGTDVLKALALGAHFVFVGRPFLYAATIGGEAGVHHAATLLRDEISRNMAMLGITSVAEMKRDLLVPSRGPIP